jgi:glutamine amidotransferase
MIAIIDYKTGNLGSIANMCEYLGYDAVITRDKEVIEKASHIILPGVGSFDRGMNYIHEFGLFDLLNDLVLVKKKPILGICLGMQLMCNKSEEGVIPGFGWIDTDVIKFKNRNIKIPHMGWNKVMEIKNGKLLKQDENINWRFYFVHSYHIGFPADIDAYSICNYDEDFVCLVEKENIFAAQFHPEKSHKFGFKLISNFLSQ